MDRIYPESSCIVFFISGKVRVTGNALIKCTLSSGSMMLLPKNAPVHGVTLTACEFVTCLLPDTGMEIESFFRRLKPFLTSDFDYRFVTLPVDPLLESYAKMIRLVCSRIEVTEDFSRMKLRELFFYLETLYSPEDLARFFFPLIGGDSYEFRNFVVENYMKFKDIKTFAAAASMSLSTFYRKFKATFGESASKWLDDRKAENIYKDITMSELTLTQISDKYFFSSQAYLTYYCRRHFGVSPAALRKDR